MVTERDEADEWPGEVDPINVAICPLITTIIEMTVTGSPERAAAMNEVMQAAERIKWALNRPKFN